MEFKEFEKEFVETLRARGVSFTQVDTVKRNDQVLHGFAPSTENGISPNFYLEDAFRAFQEGGVTCKDLVDGMLRAFKTTAPLLNSIPTIDRELVLQRAIPTLVNAGLNTKFLKNKPYVEFLDLAIVFCVPIGEVKRGVSFFYVTNALLDHCGIGLEELQRSADENAKTLLAPKCLSLLEVVAGVLPGENPGGCAVPMWVLTEGSGLCGAGVLLDKDFMKSVSKKLNGDFVILPSSVAECIAVPYHKEMVIGDFKNMVSEVNQAELKPSEILSYSVYLYEGSSGKIKIL